MTTLKGLVEEGHIDSQRYIAFLRRVLEKSTHPIFVISDNVSFHKSADVRMFLAMNRKKIRMFFLPTHAPELNPDEQVWNEIKNNQLGKQSIKNKLDLHKRIHRAFTSLQRQVNKIRAFFQLPDTRYAASQASAM